MNLRWLAIGLVASFLAVPLPATAAPITIQYSAADLSDIVPGEDLWQYSYLVSGFTFQASQGFSIYFDETLYKNLQNPPPAPNADWDVLTFEPDINLASPGVYDAFALAGPASLADPFVLDFVWLGLTGTPASQFFEVYDGDPGTVLESGFTTAVPEPSTLFLLATGGAGLTRRLRRRFRTG